MQRDLPQWIRRWPRGLRLSIAWTALALTVLLVIPAAITACFFLAQVDTCTGLRCTTGYVWLVEAATIAVLLPLVILWTRFLQRMVSYREPRDSESNYVG
jgi:chromate transport protein ChrA